MKKYLISFLFAFIFLIPFVKADDIEITDVTVNIPSVPPTAGEDINAVFTTPIGVGYEPASWLNNGKMFVHFKGDGLNTLSGKYQTGEQYVWGIVVCPTEGYTFKEGINNVTFHVNGLDIDDTSIVESYGTSVNAITCRGLDITFMKTAGVANDFLTKPEYNNEAPINEDQKFTFSISLTNTIVLEKYVNSNWVTINTYNATAENEVEITIPGNDKVEQVQYRLSYQDESIQKKANFVIDWKDYSKVLDHIVVNLPTYPTLGGDIVKDFSVPDGVNYEPVPWHNGQLFVYLKDNGSVEMSGKYEAKEYKWSAVVCPKEGYSFVSDISSLTFEVNGIDLNNDMFVSSYGKSVNAATCRGIEIRFKELIDLTVKTPKLSISSYNNKVTLAWNEQYNAKKYEIQRSNDNKKWSKIDTVTGVTYTNKSLTYGKKYYYRVKAYDGKKWTKYSNVVSKKIVPNKVELSIKSIGSNNIKLSWEKVSTTGYEIYNSTDNKKWTKVATISKNDTLEYNVKKLKENKTYYFKVRAYKTVSGKKIYGKYSEVVSAKTAPKKPEVTLKLIDYNKISFNFTTSKGATYYLAQSDINEKFDSEGVTNYTLTEPTVTELTGELGKTLYVRVKACNKSDKCSGWTTSSLKYTPKAPKLSLKTTSKKVTSTINTVNGSYNYQLYMSTSKKGKYKLLKEFNKSIVLSGEDLEELEAALEAAKKPMEYTMKSKKGVTYYFKVRSYSIVNDKKVYSPYSGIKSIKSK